MTTKMAKMKIIQLPFVVDRDGTALPKADFSKNELPRCFWHVQSTGNYSDDSRIGRRYALKYLAYEEDNRDGGGILVSIVKDMPRPLGAIEVGFLALVCFAARAGAYEARRINTYWEKSGTDEGRS